jgi:NAD+ kinase
VLRADPRNVRAQALAERLSPLLDGVDLPPDLQLVLGGDGFMLASIRAGGPDPLYMGLNAGRVGFMLNEVPASLETLVEQLATRAWSELQVPRLRVTAETVGGDTITDVALNDVYLERSTGQTAQLRVRVDGVRVVERVVCDGLIVSTALGSTAYAFSAGNAACHPRLRLLQLTAICPHAPKMAPLNLPDDASVSVESLFPERRPTRLVCDGFDHPDVASIQVSDAASDVRLAFLAGHDLTATLVRKILLP